MRSFGMHRHSIIYRFFLPHFDVFGVERYVYGVEIRESASLLADSLSYNQAIYD